MRPENRALAGWLFGLFGLLCLTVVLLATVGVWGLLLPGVVCVLIGLSLLGGDSSRT